MLDVILFHIWKQRNQRRMQGKADPKQELLKRYILTMTEIGFEEGRYKRRCKNGKKQIAL